MSKSISNAESSGFQQINLATGHGSKPQIILSPTKSNECISQLEVSKDLQISSKATYDLTSRSTSSLYVGGGSLNNLADLSSRL